MSKPSLLFAASEVYPFAKSGGLADVAYSLPRALRQNYEVNVVLPLYKFIDRKKFSILSLNKHFDVHMGKQSYPVELYGCEYEGLSYRFIYSPTLCDKDFLYGTAESGYEDNALRFGIFNYAIVELLRQKDYVIAHLNDWQSALVPLLVKEETQLKTKTLFTIHNLAYQGTFEKRYLEALGIDLKHFSMEGLEFYDQVNFMKAGIAYADKITTVSPTYAKEILTAEFGCGLEGFLRLHENKLVGIVNGIDAGHFSPDTDTALVSPYNNLTAKAPNKSAYLKEVSLKRVKKPLFVFIGRFTWQKGLDLLTEVLEAFAQKECNIAILGEGEEKYHAQLQAIADHNKNIYLDFGYDEALSHRMYAAADFLLMPSLFEPCGLNQMIAMAYAQIPLVHKVGGLADTVNDYKTFDATISKGYGITFSQPSKVAFLNAFDEALALYADKSQYNKIAKHNMLCDFSWQESATSYTALYKNITQKRTHG